MMEVLITIGKLFLATLLLYVIASKLLKDDTTI